MTSKSAFTIVELLVVIAIIAVIAAIFVGVGNNVSIKSRIQLAQAEEGMLAAAIDSYNARYGFYPSSSGLGTPSPNPLYYELIGTTVSNNVSAGTVTYTTLDDRSTISTNNTAAYFGVLGFINCTKGSGDDAHPALAFLSSLNPDRAAKNNAGVYVITTAAASDATYQPLPGYSTLSGHPANPWNYRYPGTNNPNSYDLSLQLFVGGKTYLICNWTRSVQVQ